MMQPRFDDLIEYVRAGETDPEMQELLAGNPDGQELLKQARFICKVLHDRYGASGDIGNVADAGGAWDDLSDVELDETELFWINTSGISFYHTTLFAAVYNAKTLSR